MRLWLRNARSEKGLTHDQVAERSKISRSYYTHIENGTKTPTVAVAKRIGLSLGIDWTIFFETERSLEEQKPA